MKPNIVILLLDAVRAQNLPFYGYGRNTTPFLFSMREDMAIYENAISSSYWTMPSVASLFTGMYTSGHGLVADGDRLDESLATIPLVLRQHGYRCSAFVRNIYVSEYSGLNGSFHDFYSKYGLDTVKRIISIMSKRVVDRLQPPGITRSCGNVSGDTNLLKEQFHNVVARCFDVLIDRGSGNFVHCFSKWLEQYKSNPFFAYLHFFETHSPYRAPLKFAFKFLTLRENIKKLFINHDHLKHLLDKCQMTSEDFDILISAYDNSINYADHLIGEVVRLLQRHRVYDETLLIVLSDHGDNIGDHGMMFHYFSLYDTLIKIPFLIKYPASIGLEGRITKLVQNIDIVPTILSILNIQDKKVWDQIQGNDLLGKASPRHDPDLAISELVKIFGPDRIQYRNLFSRFDRRLLSVRTKDRKVIYSSRGDHECYDLTNDPTESHNLYQTEERFGDLMKKASTYFTRMEDFYVSNREKIEAETINNKKIEEDIASQLKSMGYM